MQVYKELLDKEERKSWYLLCQQSEPVCPPGKRMIAQTLNRSDVLTLAYCDIVHVWVVLALHHYH